MDDAAQRPRFEFVSDSQPTGDVLVCGLSSFGLAALTAVDYLVDQTTLQPAGHVETPDLSTITPFENGTPRHPVRLFDSPDLSTTVLVSEIAVPTGASRTFGRSLLAWAETVDIDEIVLLSGVPVAHGPADHRTFYVANESYQERRLGDVDVPAMGTGYLEGVPATLLSAAIDSPVSVCDYVTPVHGRAPDAEAALRLLETLVEVYDVPVDTAPLESFAEEIRQYYTDLAERLETDRDDDLPEDRMYM